MTTQEEIQASWKRRWEDAPVIRPSCYNRPAFVDVVISKEFGIEFNQRMTLGCPHWQNVGGNAHVRAYCDSAGGRRTPWSACNGCRWKNG